jgi:polyhydroxyalkanoate synthesis regulator phasin
VAENDLIKRLLDAGMAFTQLTQAKAESIVGELVRAGEVRVEEAQATVQHLLDKGRENTEQLVDLVREEITKQLSALGVGAPRRVAAPAAPVAPVTTKAAGRKATAKKSAGKKAGTKKAGAKKAGAKKAAATKASAKKAAKKKSADRR